MKRIRASRSAVTLLELLVVISVIVVAATMLLSMFAKLKDAGSRAACLGNLRQLHLAISSQAADNDNRFFSITSSGLGWMYYLAPYLSLKGTEESAPIFKCPADKTIQKRTYKMNSTVSRKTFDNIGYRRVSDVLKPSSKILLFDIGAEDPTVIPLWGDSTVAWAHYYENILPSVPESPYPRMHFNGKQLNALMFDGSVQSIPCPVEESYFYWDEE